MVRLSILCLLLGLYRVQSLFCGDFPENECVERNLCRIQSGHEGCSAAETCCPTKDVLRFPVPGVPACGYANRDSLTFNIAEEDTAEAELPWMVLLLDARNGQAVGGGSLIKPDVVLSATTTTRNLLESQLIVRAGEWDLSSDTEMGKHEDVAIRKIVRHPDFQLNSGANNVALLFLERPLQRTRHINLICLPSPNRQFTRNRCIVSGWGKKNIMKKIEVPLVDNNTCEQKLRQLFSASFNLHDSLICAGGETGKDTCKVGGGSPLVCSHQSDPNRYEQVGIVNFGAGCGEAIPTVYTDVSKMRPWIFQQILENLLGSQE